MNLKTQLSSDIAMTKILARKQITLLSSSMTLNLAFDNMEISGKPQKLHIEEIGKNEFDLQFKPKIE